MRAPALWLLVLVELVMPVYWWAPVAIGPLESAVATFWKAGEPAPVRLASARLVRSAGVMLERLVLLLPAAVVRKVRKAIAQALASELGTLGVLTLMLLARSRAPPEATIGLVVLTPRQAPVSKIAFVLFVQWRVGAVSLAAAIL